MSTQNDLHQKMLLALTYLCFFGWIEYEVTGNVNWSIWADDFPLVGESDHMPNEDPKLRQAK